MTKKLIAMMALSFALSACESEPAESNANSNANKPAASATGTPAPVSPVQEATPVAGAELKTGDKVKVAINGTSAEAKIVAIDEKGGKVTVRVDGEKQDRTVATADVVKR